MDLLPVVPAMNFFSIPSDRSVGYPCNRLIHASASATLFGTSASRLKLLWPSGRPSSVAIYAYDVRSRYRIYVAECFVALEILSSIACQPESASRDEYMKVCSGVGRLSR